jgi:phosphonoacetaldehyde hydrolase
VGVALSGNIAGRTPEELAALPPDEVDAIRRKAAAILREAGADHVIDTVADLPGADRGEWP